MAASKKSSKLTGLNNAGVTYFFPLKVDSPEFVWGLLNSSQESVSSDHYASPSLGYDLVLRFSKPPQEPSCRARGKDTSILTVLIPFKEFSGESHSVQGSITLATFCCWQSLECVFYPGSVRKEKMEKGYCTGNSLHYSREANGRGYSWSEAC